MNGTLRLPLRRAYLLPVLENSRQKPSTSEFVPCWSNTLNMLVRDHWEWEKCRGKARAKMDCTNIREASDNTTEIHERFTLAAKEGTAATAWNAVHCWITRITCRTGSVGCNTTERTPRWQGFRGLGRQSSRRPWGCDAGEILVFFRDRYFLTCRTYRAVLQARLHTCDTILSQTSTLLSTLNNLKLGFSSVADQTASFQAQCDNLVQEEVDHLTYKANFRNNCLTTLTDWPRIYNHLNPLNLYLANWMLPVPISSPNQTLLSRWNESTRV